MQTGLGCLFALIFGFFIFLFSIAHTLVRTIYSVLGFTPRRESGSSSQPASPQTSARIPTHQSAQKITSRITEPPPAHPMQPGKTS